MADLPTVARALEHARALGVARLDAQLLLAHVLSQPRAWLMAHDDALLTQAAQGTIAAQLGRRANGEPLAYITGTREFHGLLLHVTPDVLIPRPDTETLVDWALERLIAFNAPRVLDLGTGSGAIALALKYARPDAHVHASDASAKALTVARANGERLALAVEWRLGDWWLAIDPGLKFDLVAANPPYVAPGDPHLFDLRHEPIAALAGRGDGLGDIALIIDGAVDHLHANGGLLIEHGFDQAAFVCEHLLRAGFSHVRTRSDLAGRPRVSAGMWRGSID